MLGAKIGDYHTVNNFGLGWLGMSISEAKVKTHYIEIEGRDGPLDATEALSGRPVYEQRTLILTFDVRGSWEDYMTRCSSIDSATNGKLLKIFLDIDPQYFWIGRGTWKHTKTADGDETHTFTAKVEPFKYKKTLTQTSARGGQTVTLSNLQAPSYPLFSTTSGNIQVKFGTVSVLIPSGTDVPMYDITLLEGSNTLTFTGSGSITIKYQEGTL